MSSTNPSPLIPSIHDLPPRLRSSFGGPLVACLPAHLWPDPARASKAPGEGRWVRQSQRLDRPANGSLPAAVGHLYRHPTEVRLGWVLGWMWNGRGGATLKDLALALRGGHEGVVQLRGSGVPSILVPETHLALSFHEAEATLQAWSKLAPAEELGGLGVLFEMGLLPGLAVGQPDLGEIRSLRERALSAYYAADPSWYALGVAAWALANGSGLARREEGRALLGGELYRVLQIAGALECQDWWHPRHAGWSYRRAN